MRLRRERVAGRIGPIDDTPIDDTEPLVTLADSRAGALVSTPAGHAKQPVLRGYGFVLAVLSAILVTGATAAAVSGSVGHELVLSLFRQPEKYTVLYFPGQGLTQVKPSPGEQTLSVAFSIVNHEGKTTRFPYAVQVVDRAKTPIGRTEGSVEVADGDEATETVAVEVPASAVWSAVEVNLEDRAEYLRLLAPHSEATGA
jgi:hypothetical protein